MARRYADTFSYHLPMGWQQTARRWTRFFQDLVNDTMNHFVREEELFQRFGHPETAPPMLPRIHPAPIVCSDHERSKRLCAEDKAAP